MKIKSYELKLYCEHHNLEIRYHGNENIVIQMTDLKDISKEIRVPRHILKMYLKLLEIN